MTELLLTDFKFAREQRQGKNDARRILSERDKARSATSGAAKRWPFELLQNAHDPGPRAGSDLVDVKFSATNSALTFLHNGRPFTGDDLAALLSGGSNKEYDSPDTTGRYGTGFLVTHVLSVKFRLRGLISRGSGYEKFRIDLDRSGNDEAILMNAEAAEHGIRAAAPVALTSNPWTAKFVYPLDNHEAANVGIEVVRLSKAVRRQKSHAAKLSWTWQKIAIKGVGRSDYTSTTLLTTYRRHATDSYPRS